MGINQGQVAFIFFHFGLACPGFRHIYDSVARKQSYLACAGIVPDSSQHDRRIFVAALTCPGSFVFQSQVNRALPRNIACQGRFFSCQGDSHGRCLPRFDPLQRCLLAGRARKGQRPAMIRLQLLDIVCAAAQGYGAAGSVRCDKVTVCLAPGQGDRTLVGAKVARNRASIERHLTAVPAVYGIRRGDRRRPV